MKKEQKTRKTIHQDKCSCVYGNKMTMTYEEKSGTVRIFERRRSECEKRSKKTSVGFVSRNVQAVSLEEKEQFYQAPNGSVGWKCMDDYMLRFFFFFFCELRGELEGGRKRFVGAKLVWLCLGALVRWRWCMPSSAWRFQEPGWNERWTPCLERVESKRGERNQQKSQCRVDKKSRKKKVQKQRLNPCTAMWQL